MPYRIVERDDEHCVAETDEEGGEVTEILKCYADRDDAVAYLRALYANVEDAGRVSSLESFVQTLDLELEMLGVENND